MIETRVEQYGARSRKRLSVAGSIGESQRHLRIDGAFEIHERPTVGNGVLGDANVGAERAPDFRNQLYRSTPYLQAVRIEWQPEQCVLEHVHNVTGGHIARICAAAVNHRSLATIKSEDNDAALLPSFVAAFGSRRKEHGI